MAAIIRRYTDLFQQTRHWLVATTALFALSIAAGAVGANLNPSGHREFLRTLTGTLSPMLDALNTGALAEATLLIFLSNVRAMLLSLGLGALVLPGAFGLPMLPVGVTGYTIGVLLSFSHDRLGLTLLALVPHGFVELPAVLMAAAWSAKLSYRWLLPGSAGRRADVWRETVVECVWITPLVIVLLAVAAVIEVYVTGRLIGLPTG